MKKMGLVFAASLLALTACQGEAKEKEPVDQKEEKEVVEKQPENENVLVLNIDGEEKEVEAVAESIGTGGAYAVKTVEGLPVKARAEGDFLYAKEGEMKGISFVIYENDAEKSSAEGSAQVEAMTHGGDFPETVNLDEYPLLKEKYDFYMHSSRPGFNRYAFTKDNADRNKVLVVVMEIPSELVNDETVALAEAMALSVEIK